MKLQIKATEIERDLPHTRDDEMNALKDIVDIFRDRETWYLAALFTDDLLVTVAEYIKGDVMPDLVAALIAARQAQIDMMNERDAARAELAQTLVRLETTAQARDAANAAADAAAEAIEARNLAINRESERAVELYVRVQRLEAESIRLKARLYDYEHAADE